LINGFEINQNERVLLARSMHYLFRLHASKEESMKNTVMMIAILTILTGGMLFAASPFEDDMKTWDPYIADTKQGFDSIFVNPAGMAGQSSFVASVEFGTFGQLEDYARVQDFIDLYNTFSNMNEPSNSAEAVSLMQDLLVEDQFDALIAGTTLVGEDLSTLTAADLEGLTADDVTAIIDNYEAADSEGPFADLFDVHYDLAVESRVGFLIGGIGGGVYYRQSFPFSAGAAGFTNLKSEIGAIAGAGFNIGPIALGASLNYGLLLTYPQLTMDEYNSDLGNAPMLYGYAWGVDAGAIWNVTDSLSIGVVLNDIIGTTMDDAGNTTMNQLLDGTYVDDVSFDYEFTIDIDVGVTWQPDWRFFSPKFSFDYYDIVGLIRYLDEYGEDMDDQVITRMVFNQLRVGASLKLLDFLTLGGQYYNNFFSAGIGLDILFFEVGFEIMVDDAFLYEDINDQTQVGASLLLRVKL
jgi:hypothetical protein